MSSCDERSPKRQRRSYSPASPALDPGRLCAQPPQTPPPSVHMSPSWQSAQLPGLGSHGAPESTAGNTFPTPPSTAGMMSQTMTQGTRNEGIGAESSQPTPVAEVDSDVVRIGDSDQIMRDAQPSQMMDSQQSSSLETSQHRRTDHERQEMEDTVGPLPGASVLYKFSTEPIAAARPLFSQNVIELYGMQHVQASVARKDPKTGAKINKLRKSYDGKVKELGLEGRNKATKQEGWFTGFLHPGWDAKFEDGRNMWDVEHAEFVPGSESDAKLLGLLNDALNMRPGRLPRDEHNEWKNVLGLEEAIIPTKQALTPNPNGVNNPATAFLAKTAPGTALRGSAPASPRAAHIRPDRQGKKRRYDERSYEGYTEAYTEDDGYDTAGMDDPKRGGSNKRQKRKDFAPSNSPPFSNLSGSNGNMVGIRSS